MVVSSRRREGPGHRRRRPRRDGPPGRPARRRALAMATTASTPGRAAEPEREPAGGRAVHGRRRPWAIAGHPPTDVDAGRRAPVQPISVASAGGDGDSLAAASPGVAAPNHSATATTVAATSADEPPASWRVHVDHEALGAHRADAQVQPDDAAGAAARSGRRGRGRCAAGRRATGPRRAPGAGRRCRSSRAAAGRRPPRDLLSTTVPAPWVRMRPSWRTGSSRSSAADSRLSRSARVQISRSSAGRRTQSSSTPMPRRGVGVRARRAAAGRCRPGPGCRRSTSSRGQWTSSTPRRSSADARRSPGVELVVHRVIATYDADRQSASATALAGAHPQQLVDRHAPDLAVADLAGAGRPPG